MKKLRIALAAPLFIPLPAGKYGGTERVITSLAGELARMGHDVTVSCAGGSRLACTMLHPIERAIWEAPHAYSEIPSHLLQLQQLRARAADFDIIHFHNGFWQLGAAALSVPAVTTFHCRLDRQDLPALIRQAAATGLISISDNQRAGYSGPAWLGSVYNGIPETLYTCNEQSSGYLAYIGRLSREKGCEAAVRIAREAGYPLKIAGAPDKSPAGLEYFETVIRPLLSLPDVEYVGEIGDAEKQDFLGQAAALLFPISWPEPFGLVMIEAMATGTPVLAFRAGSVPEVVDEGLTGYIAQDVADAVRLLPSLLRLDRKKTRQRFDQRFTARLMAENYLSHYYRMTEAAA